VKIELLGTQCSNCIALEKVVKEAIAKSGKFVEFEKVSELGKILTVEGVLGLM
jgi:hypothetical protein